MGLILKHQNTRPAPETVLYDYQIFFLNFVKLLLKTQKSNLGRVKEWRVTLGVTLAVSAVSSFVPV